MANEHVLRRREYELLLARCADQVTSARGALDRFDRLEDQGPTGGTTVTDAGLIALEHLATTRDACADAVRVLAVELLNRGAKSETVAAAAHAERSSVYRWRRDALAADDD